MIQKLNDWFANPNRKFSVGVKMYHRMKIDNKMDSFFGSVEDPKQKTIHFNMLESELRRMLNKLQNGTYYWRVKACVDDGGITYGGWSEVESFVVNGQLTLVKKTKGAAQGLLSYVHPRNSMTDKGSMQSAIQ